jgi:hypothetical protein
MRKANRSSSSSSCLGAYCWFLMADPEGNEFCLAPFG